VCPHAIKIKLMFSHFLVICCERFTEPCGPPLPIWEKLTSYNVV